MQEEFRLPDTGTIGNGSGSIPITHQKHPSSTPSLLSPFPCSDFSFLRSLSGLSQGELAGVLGLSQQTVSGYETGRIKVSEAALAEVLALCQERVERFQSLLRGMDE